MTDPATVLDIDPTNTDDPVLDPQQTGDVLLVCDRTVINLIKRGELRAARVGRQWRIRRSWINEYLDRSAGIPA